MCVGREDRVMLDAETVARIRRLYYAEHWKIGTIVQQLGVHRDAVIRALERAGMPQRRAQRRRQIDPFVPFIRETLERYPTLRATRLHQMLVERGFEGSAIHLRRLVRGLRPSTREAFLVLRSIPGERGEVDWADFGKVTIGRAERRLSAFVLTLAHSRAMYVEFFLDQRLENFLRGHVRAFSHFGGAPRTIATDNLRSVVLERRGDVFRLHDRYLELAGHYHFQPAPCRPARGNEKGRVERSIRFLRESFFAGRTFVSILEMNRAVLHWIAETAMTRPWPDDHRRSVEEVFGSDEQPRLLRLPEHPFEVIERTLIRSSKTIYVRFDRNDYSIPHPAIEKNLTLLATDTDVRILDGTIEIARHRRSFDAGDRVTDPAHTEALLAFKRNAAASAAQSPLLLAAPEAAAFLDAAVLRGAATAAVERHLSRLLPLYGADLLRTALLEALARGTATLESVEYLIEKARRAARRVTPMLIDLSDRPDLAALHVQPHALEGYDQLTDNDTDPGKDNDHE